MSNKIISNLIDSGMIGVVVPEGSTVIVGFSGGPDSLCLLHSLAQIAEPYNLTLVPVHINHMLRKNAADEADNACRICDRLDLDCMFFEADCKGLADELGISTEEAGRNIRYEIFDDVAMQLEEEGTDREQIFIALGHNADDQSETVLFRLLRGTGTHGLAGIQAVRSSEMGYMIIRPLLDITRAEIEEYCRVNKLHPNHDESNDTSDYTRNKIRNELIPYLEENYNPNIKEALRRYAALAEMDDEFLNSVAMDGCTSYLEIDETGHTLRLDLTEIRNTPLAVNSRIAKIILDILNLGSDTAYPLINAVTGLIYSDNPSTSIDLPHGYRAFRQYDMLIFTDDEALMQDAVPNIALTVKPRIMKLREYRQAELEGVAAFDFDLFNEAYPGRVGEITIRTRREGDFIAIGNGRKKLQDFFTDAKIRKALRNSILLACIDSEVLWILPSAEFGTETMREKGRFSHNFQIKNTTERVLCLETEDIL